MKQHRWFTSRGAAVRLAGMGAFLISCARDPTPSAWGYCAGRLAVNRNADFVVKVHSVRVWVTDRGRPLSPERSGDGGTLVFLSQTDTTVARVKLEARNYSEFTVHLPPATYTIRYEADASELVPEFALVGGVVRDSLVIDRDTAVSVDLRTVEADVDVTIDGHVPTAPFALVFTSEDGTRSRVLGADRAARTTLARVVRGRYLVDLDPLEGCVNQRGSLLCQSVRLGVLDTEVSRSLAVRLATTTVPVRVESNGIAPTDVDATDFELRADRRAGLRPVEITATRPTITLYEGLYDVWPKPRGSWPNERTSLPIAQAVRVRADEPLTVRGYRLWVTPRVRVDGTPVEQLAAEVDARLVFFGRDARPIQTIALFGRAQPLRVWPMVAGVALVLANHRCDDRAPCGVSILRPISLIDRDIELDVDLRSIGVQLDAELDYETLATANWDQLDVQGATLGYRFASVTVGRVGTDTLRVLPGQYELVTRGASCAELDPIFCEPQAKIATGLAWSASGRYFVSLTSSMMRGNIRVQRTSGGSVPLDGTRLVWTDEFGHPWSAPVRFATGAFAIGLPKRRYVARIEGGFCNMDNAASSVCFATTVFGCD